MVIIRFYRIESNSSLRLVLYDFGYRSLKGFPSVKQGLTRGISCNQNIIRYPVKFFKGDLVRLFDQGLILIYSL